MALDPVSIAIQVALVLASILLSAQNVETGKLDDIGADTGSYGRILPIVYGTQMITGQTIWIANNKLVERKKKKKFLFGLAGSVTTYTYFATLAVALTSNRVQVRRIWAGSELIYDATGTSTGGSLDGVQIEIKDGSQTQSSSSTITGVDGASGTPAYRGISMLVFKDFALEKHGNSIPQFKVEVVEKDEPDNIGFDITLPIGGRAFQGVDKYGRIWGIDGPGDLIQAVNASTNQIDTTHDLSGTIDFNGTFFNSVFYEPAYNSLIVSGAVVEATTGGLVTGFPSGTAVLSNNSYSRSRFAYVDTFHDAGSIAVSGSGFGSLENVFSLQTAMGESTANERIIAFNGANYAFCYVVTGPRLGIYGNTGLVVGPIDLSVYGFTPGQQHTLAWSDRAQKIIVVGNGGIAAFNAGGNLLSHNTRACAPNESAMLALNQYDYETFWLATSDNHLIQLNVNSLDILREIDCTTITGDPVSACADVMILQGLNALVINQNHTSPDWVTVFLDRAPLSETTVQHIVEDLAERTGLPQSRLDATDASRTIGGLIVAGDDARRAIDDLLNVTGYDLVEEDGKIKIKDRGLAVVANVDFDDLGVSAKDGADFRLERNMAREADAPWKVELGFADIDGDFESNVATASRAIDAVNTRAVLSVDTPIALDVNTAKSYAAKLLSQAWRERAGVSLTLPLTKYGRLSAGDVVTIPDGNNLLQVKITRAGGATDLQIKGVVDDPTGIDTNLSGTSRTSAVSSLTAVAAAALPVLLDSALPADTADVPNGYGVTARPVLSGTVIGNIDIVNSTDGGESYNLVTSLEDGMPVSNTIALLGDVTNPRVMDRTSEIRVFLQSPPASATREVLWNDPLLNLCFVQANDDWELVQFETVTDLGGGEFSLSGLMRGLRGTEHLTGSHSNADLVVMFGEAYVRAGGQIDFQIAQKYAALRSDDDDAIIVDYEPQLRGLKPLSPVNVDVQQSGFDNQISWTRRTRLGGADLDGTDVPLSEATESYEIDIYDAGVFKRTLVSSSPSVTYTEADQITDLGNVYQPYTAHIYQINDIVGRGEGTEHFYLNDDISATFLLFQTSFTSTSVTDGSQHAHVVMLENGATVSTLQTWGGQSGSVSCGGSDFQLSVAADAMFNFGINEWTYDVAIWHSTVPTVNHHLLTHYAPPSDREIIWYYDGTIDRHRTLQSENGVSTIEISHSEALNTGQWVVYSLSREVTGQISMYINGVRKFRQNPGFSSGTYFASTEPVLFGRNLDGYVGWAAISNIDRNGGSSIIPVRSTPYPA